jgi:S-adenosylmethionine-diacylglycerol 3-amino-3-carboxypropyl transferase
MSKPVEKVDFSKIRYANCWEDADILLEGLKPKPGSKILSIASAGDNSFALLSTDPELVLAVDLSKVQLHLCELKKVAIKNLEREECLQFLGFVSDKKRLETYGQLKSQLSTEARSYFDQLSNEIQHGIIHQGKFEKYFQLFSQKILPLIHSKKTTEKLFQEKSELAQIDFYKNKWNTWRWRMLFKLFFSKAIMGKFGRDPEFLKQVEIPVAEYIFRMTESHLQSQGAQQNFILHYNLTGQFGVHLPYYLQEEHYEKVKRNLGALQLFEGYAQDAISQDQTFDCMNLSNIFEYMDLETFQNTGKKLINGLNKEGKMAYWNLMVPRQLSKEFPEQLNFQSSISDELTQKDKGFFYHQILIEQRK